MGNKHYFLGFLLLFLPYELTIILLFSGLMFTNASLFLIGFVFLLLSFMLYGLLPTREIDYVWWDWLEFYRSNFKFEIIMILLNILISIIFLIIQIYFPQLYSIETGENTMFSIMIYFIIVSLIGIIISKKIANYFGANYINIFKQSPMGIISYSKFSYILLSNQDQRGIKYLIIAIKHLKNTYKKSNNKFVHVDEAIHILDTYNKYSNSIPYDDFSKIAQNINDHTNIEHFLNSLDIFIHKEKFEWTNGIIDTKYTLPPGTQVIGIISIGLTILIKIISLLEQTNMGNILQSILTSFNSFIDIQFFITLYFVTIVLGYWIVMIFENSILSQIYNEYMY